MSYYNRIRKRIICLRPMIQLVTSGSTGQVTSLATNMAFAGSHTILVRQVTGQVT